VSKIAKALNLRNTRFYLALSSLTFQSTLATSRITCCKFKWLCSFPNRVFMCSLLFW